MTDRKTQTPEHPRPAAATTPDELLLRLLTAPSPQFAHEFTSLDQQTRTYLIGRAREHRCLPYLCWALGQVGAPPPVPEGTDLRKRWHMRALAIQGETVRLHSLLERAGIPHLFLKGLPLAAAIYPEPWLRPMRDIDILVRPDDLVRAQEVVLENGAPIDRYVHQAGRTGTPWKKHLAPVWSPGRLIPVEVHDKVATPSAGLDGDSLSRFTARMWEHLTHVKVGGADLPVPGAAELLVHLVLHGIYDHELDNGPLFVSDIQFLLGHDARAAQRAVCLVDDLGIRRGMALALSLVRDGTPGKDALLCRLFPGAGAPILHQNAAAALLLQDSKARSHLKFSADLAERSMSEKLASLFSRVFVRRQAMIDRWHFEHRDQPPPMPLPALWLWFTCMRLANAARSRRGLPPELTNHLVTLRMLRDEERA